VSMDPANPLFGVNSIFLIPTWRLLTLLGAAVGSGRRAVEVGVVQRRDINPRR
jgi:hypothetical protein